MNRRTQQEMEEIEEEEDDSVNASRGAVDSKRTRPGRRFVLLIAVCWIVLLATMGLRIYLTSELSGNNAELYSRIQELETRENNLTQKIQNLTAGVQELTTKNQELEKKTKNLTQKIQDMTTNWNELNVSRAQWSIDSYCLGNTDDKCQACQKGWSLTEPSCYVYNDAETDNQKTWEEAQGDCRGRNSDLAVAHDSEEKEAIKKNSLGSNEFWIGLRVEDGKWKWVDGSDLSDSSWIVPPAEGHCALFYTGRDIWYSVFYTNKWSSVSCGATHQWICQQKALSV